jgi:hypothetical protein
VQEILVGANSSVSSRQTALRLGAIGVGLLAALLCAELALRIWAAMSTRGADGGFLTFVDGIHSEPVSHSIYRPSNDPLLGVELVPGSERRHLRVNSGGFRGPEYDLRPAPGTHRVAVLGDSETFGASLREEDTLPGQLESVLNAGDTATTYEVLNFGFPGYGTLQEERILRNRALGHAPETVVLYFVFNDPIPETQTRLLERSALDRSYLYLLLRYVESARHPSRYQRMHEERGIVGFHTQLMRSEYFAVSREAIGRMADELEDRGIRFIVAIAPEVLGFSSFRDYPYHELHALLGDLASARIEVVDPLDRLAVLSDDPTALWVTPGDCHKNARANRAVAEAIAERIVVPPPTDASD